MEIQPYLYFNGRCEEAVEFYRRVLGAKVEMLKGNDYLRVWINRAGVNYLIHFPVS